MHIPDGYLSPVISLGAGALTLPVWGVATQRAKAVLNNRTIPLLAIFSALTFTIMMFNLPVPGGTTAHGVGGTLTAIVLGPSTWRSFCRSWPTGCIGMGRAGRTVVTTTHDLEIVPVIADRVVVLGEDRRIVADGTPEHVLGDRALLLGANLIHEHLHGHHEGEAEHSHVHVSGDDHHHDAGDEAHDHPVAVDA